MSFIAKCPKDHIGILLYNVLLCIQKHKKIHVIKIAVVATVDR